MNKKCLNSIINDIMTVNYKLFFRKYFTELLILVFQMIHFIFRPIFCLLQPVLKPLLYFSFKIYTFFTRVKTKWLYVSKIDQKTLNVNFDLRIPVKLSPSVQKEINQDLILIVKKYNNTKIEKIVMESIILCNRKKEIKDLPPEIKKYVDVESSCLEKRIPLLNKFILLLHCADHTSFYEKVYIGKYVLTYNKTLDRDI